MRLRFLFLDYPTQTFIFRNPFSIPKRSVESKTGDETERLAVDVLPVRLIIKREKYERIACLKMHSLRYCAILQFCFCLQWHALQWG
jgi:hypothetical protein